LCDNIYECACYNRCHGNAVKEFYVLLVGVHLLLRDFGPYGIIFMTMCVLVSFLTGSLLVQGIA
jgi:hypothetical protein